MDSTNLIEPLAKTIGILWDEVEKAGKTKEALLKFKNGLRAIRILVGNCDGMEFLKVVLLNHMSSVLMMVNEQLEKEARRRTFIDH